MKSLNTVIEVLEACQNDAIECFECPMRHETECEVKSVALAYLKEYQKIEDEYEELKDWWAEEYDENQPLTWDELKQMEGKPVWIEFEKNGNHWLIITDIKSNGAVGRGVYGENAPLYKDRIGTDWQAYRKERV